MKEEQGKEDSKDFVFGTRAVIEAIKADKQIDKVLIQRGLKNELTHELLKLCKEHNLPMTYVPLEKLNRITRKNHQGTICYLSAIEYASLEHIIAHCYEKGELPLVLALDRITDVRNFGAIARSAECAGVHAIIIPTKGSAQINSDAVKASAGALHHIPVCRVESLQNALIFLKESGLHLIACSEKTENLMYSAPLAEPCAIIMGSEEDGISPHLIRTSDKVVKIPMQGNIGSLNVSVATGLIIFEAVRQRQSVQA
jgi:23S rRNA (guanosine2251-2'-O)-methyltransferase